MKALSIRQPWAWMILHAGKDIENRSWPTTFRGRILIHAGQRTELEDWDYYRHEYPAMPALDQLQRGGIVGEVTIAGCVSHSDSEWFNGPYGFLLRNPKCLPFRPLRGMLGFFEVSTP